jgi:hypothetical protein
MRQNPSRSDAFPRDPARRGRGYRVTASLGVNWRRLGCVPCPWPAGARHIGRTVSSQAWPGCRTSRTGQHPCSFAGKPRREPAPCRRTTCSAFSPARRDGHTSRIARPPCSSPDTPGHVPDGPPGVPSATRRSERSSWLSSRRTRHTECHQAPRGYDSHDTSSEDPSMGLVTRRARVQWLRLRPRSMNALTAPATPGLRGVNSS